jgi:hypothetical protein
VQPWSELPFDVWKELQQRGHVERGDDGKPTLTANGQKTFTAMEAGDDVPEFTYEAEEYPLHFPIHARSSHAIIPSTMTKKVVATNKVRRVNRIGRRVRRASASEPVVRTRNQYINIGDVHVQVRSSSNPKEDEIPRVE